MHQRWKFKTAGVAAALALALACTGPKGPQGEQGPAGKSCTVKDNGDGTKTIECEDGTKATISDGMSCTVKDNGDGTKTIECEDGTSVTVSDGTGCTVTDNGDGTKTIECGDGSSATVADGSSCTVKDNGDGTKTISCDDGSTATVSDGKDAPCAQGKMGPTVNYVAVHDPDSPAYDPDCVCCHTGKPNEASLDPENYPGFHAFKLSLKAIPGDTPNEKCVYCHKRVDLSPNRSGGNLRRQVDVSVCAKCHSSGDHKFYQGM